MSFGGSYSNSSRQDDYYSRGRGRVTESDMKHTQKRSYEDSSSRRRYDVEDARDMGRDRYSRDHCDRNLNRSYGGRYESSSQTQYDKRSRYSPPTSGGHRYSPPRLVGRRRIDPSVSSYRNSRTNTITSAGTSYTDDDSSEIIRRYPTKSHVLANGDMHIFRRRPVFMEALEDQSYCRDVRLVCADGDYWTNKLILINSAPSLGIMLNDQLPGEVVTMILPDYPVQEVKYFIDFVCKGSVSIPKKWRLAVIRLMYNFGWTNPDLILTDLEGKKIPLDVEEKLEAPPPPPISGLRNPFCTNTMRAETSEGMRTETPIEMRTETPIELKTETSVEGRTETPMEMRTETPMEMRTEIPVEMRIEIPVEMRIEIPVEMRTETPVEMRTETPVEMRTETPVEITAETPGEMNQSEMDGLDTGSCDLVPSASTSVQDHVTENNIQEDEQESEFEEIDNGCENEMMTDISKLADNIVTTSKSSSEEEVEIIDSPVKIPKIIDSIDLDDSDHEPEPIPETIKTIEPLQSPKKLSPTVKKIDVPIRDGWFVMQSNVSHKTFIPKPSTDTDPT